MPKIGVVNFFIILSEEGVCVVDIKTVLVII